MQLTMSLTVNKFHHLAASHPDLAKILDGLRAAGFPINTDNLPNVSISNAHGDIIFKAEPHGRKGDVVWYDVAYLPEFNKLIGASNEQE